MGRELNIKCNYDNSEYGTLEMEFNCDKNEIANSLYQIFMNLKNNNVLEREHLLLVLAQIIKDI